MMKKTIVVLIILLLAPCMTIHADTIKLKNLREDIEAKITELTQDYIGVVISKNDIESVAIQPSDKRAYPDLVSFLTSGIRLECKITSVNPGSIGVRIPRSEVVSIHMVFAPEITQGEKQVSRPSHPAPFIEEGREVAAKKAEPVPAPIEEVEEFVPTPVSRPNALKQEIGKEAEMHAVVPPVSRGEAKEKIKRDVIRELEEEETWPSSQVFKDEIKRELKEEFEAEREAEETVFQETQLGRVDGKILRKGQPLPECEVKIVMLVRAKIPFTGSFRQADMPSEYDGITDGEGRYHLINVTPGEYKIYWKPPTESSWIRRLNMKPDITVKGGKTTYPKDIETFKRIIN